MAENNSSATLKTAEGAPVAQWQKRHPDEEGGAWQNTNRGDAMRWRDNSQGWEIRALYEAAPQAVEAQAPAAVAVSDERAAFECDWLRRHYPLPMNTRLRDDGRYGDHIIQGQLEAWCAGRAALAATPEIPATEYSSAGDLAHDTLRCAVGNCTFNGEVAQHAAGCQKSTQPTHAEVQAEPVANCYSDDDGDTWRDCPDDSDFVEGRQLGEEFELQASIRSWSETFRVSKVPDETSDDYEVEPVAVRTAPQAQPADALDAARYRHLRDSVMVDGEINEALYVRVDQASYPNRWALVGQELDAAIDAAMAAAQAQPQKDRK